MPVNATTTCFPLLLLLSCALGATLTAAWRTADYKDAFVRVMDDLINHEEIASTGIAPSLAEGCVGRVDLTNDFVGLELNIEYLYGLFSNVDTLNTTQLIGSPSSYTVQSLSITDNIVAASVIVVFEYKSISYSLPVQIDLWLIFTGNRELKLTGYDATFRRFPQALNYLLPKVGPQIASELGVPYDPAQLSSIVGERVMIDICSVTQEFCVGDLEQYDSFDSCTQFLATQVPFGEIWEAGQNTTICRYIHKNMLKLRPDVHCPHVGPTGGDMCIPRDYEDVVANFPFPQSLIAPSTRF